MISAHISIVCKTKLFILITNVTMTIEGMDTHRGVGETPQESLLVKNIS